MKRQDSISEKVAVLGTGAVGSRLGALFAAAGHEVVYGARDPKSVAAPLGGSPQVVDYATAVRNATIVVLAVPYAGASGSVAADVLAQAGPFQGKILVDATNPLAADWSPLRLVDTSAAEQLAKAAPEANIVKAFNTVFADVMTAEGLVFDGGQRPSVFVCGDDAGARARVGALAASAGFEPVDAGPLANSRYVEAMAHLNIQLAVALGGGTQAVFRYVRRRSA